VIPMVPVISGAHYDTANNRVVITVEPCEGAEKFSVTRCNHPALLYGEWIPSLRFVEATGEQQTFYDYTAPLNSQVRYRVLSYAERGDGMLLAAKNYSPEVVVDVPGLSTWFKCPGANCHASACSCRSHG
jgi:hypothetical protein